MTFCHLHIHSEYSFLDGLCRIPELITEAVRLKIPALALTDHGGLWGVVPFYKECQKSGIKPILGCEVYVVDFYLQQKKKEYPYHLVLLAENNEGYKNLIKLVTLSHLKGFYRLPRVDKNLLAEHSRGLIALSGCIKGEIAQHILRDELDEAERAVRDYAEIFPQGNFFLEMQDHGLAGQQKINFWLKEFSEKLNTPLVATNDVHYLKPEDAKVHKILLSVQNLSTSGRSLSLPGNEHYLKSPTEMEKLFYDIPQALHNTTEIARRCNVQLDLDGINLPPFPVPKGYDSQSLLEKQTFEGAKKRYPYPLSSTVKERIAYELSIIKNTGYAGYFLIVKDIVDFAKNNHIIVGIGRGSAAGSIVCYCLGITNVDPIKYGLIFERFLNPERISLPDIDIDLCHRGRQQVLDYIRNRFGKDCIAHVGAFSTFQARAAFRDTGRALGLNYKTIDRVCSFIPYSHITLEDAQTQSPHLSTLIRSNRYISQAFNLAQHIQGLPRHMTQHPSGVVIAKKPLTDYVPLQKASGQEIITQANMDILEDWGLVKIDLLGLRFLTVIDDTLKLVKKLRGIHMRPEDIPLDDKKTFRALSRGETTSTFQLESPGMRSLLKKVQPQNIEDISAVLALYRPGPLQSNMTQEFVERHRGQKEVSYPHPSLIPILCNTSGVFLYQEQLMQTSQRVAGYTLGEADLLRRAITHRHKEILQELKPDFIKRAQARGFEQETANQIFSVLKAFGGFCFNKSHSISYAIMAYRTVYLKEHFPLEYFSALLSLYIDIPSKLQLYISEVRHRKIKLLGPDINKSQIDFIPEGNTDIPSIRTGFALVKNLGPQGIKEILTVRSERSFKDFFDFCHRVDRRIVNSKAIESLIFSGAFDSFGLSRPVMLISLKSALMERRTSRDQISLFEEKYLTPTLAKNTFVKDFTPRQKAQQELYSLGHYVTYHPPSTRSNRKGSP